MNEPDFKRRRFGPATVGGDIVTAGCGGADSIASVNRLSRPLREASEQCLEETMTPLASLAQTGTAVAGLYSSGEKCHYFACEVQRLLETAVRSPLRHEPVPLFRRHLEFVTALIAGSDSHRTYDLRLVSYPDPNVYTSGRIRVAILCRLDRASAEEASQHATEFLHLLQAFFNEYECELATAEAVKQLLDPFAINHLVGLTRRHGWQRLDSSRLDDRESKALGFNSRSSKQPVRDSSSKDAVFHVCPYVPSSLPADALFKLLLLHSAPVVVSCRIRPAALTADEEGWLEEQISLCERYAQVTLGQVPDNLSALQPTLREQARLYQQYQCRLLSGLRSNAALVTLELGSPEPIPQSVVHAVGATVTEPAGAAMHQESTLSGGYNAILLDGSSDSLEALRCLNLMLPTCPSAPARSERLPYLCDPIEAAACFRLPTLTNEGEVGLEVKTWRELVPSRNLPGHGTLIGTTRPQSGAQPVRLAREDRLRHTYLVGQTGVGKTSVLKTMILDDLEAGEGVCVIDPHGDLFRDILARVPAHRLEDVVLLDPTDTEFPVGLNLLEYDTPSQRHFVIQELVGIILRFIEDQFGIDAVGHFTGPIFFQHVRRNLLLAMSNPDDPGTLAEFYTIYQNKGYWKRWLPLQLKDPQLEHWVENVLPQTDYLMQGNEGSSMGGYIGSKFEGFVFDPMLRNIFGQKRSTIDLRDIMDTGKILLVNLAKGELTEANSKFLGMVVLAKLQTAAMGRLLRLPKDREAFYVYVDEFQSIATQSFASLLSEGRKFGLGLILANQFTSQVNDRRIMEAIFGNVGTTICFRLGQADAELIEKEFFPAVDQRDLLNLPNWEAYVRMQVGGHAVRPFSVRTIPPTASPNEEQALRIRAFSRSRYGRDRQAVDEEIAASLTVDSRGRQRSNAAREQDAPEET